MDGQCVECGAVREDQAAPTGDGASIPLQFTTPSDAARAAQTSSAEDNIKPGTTTFPQAMARGFSRPDAMDDDSGRGRLGMVVIGVVILLGVILLAVRG